MPASTPSAPVTEPTPTEASSVPELLRVLDPEVGRILGMNKTTEIPETENIETLETSEEEETPEEETTETPEEEAEEPHLSENTQKRIDKLTRKASDATAEAAQAKEEAAAAKAEADRMKAELESREPISITPTAENPLGHIESLQDLDAQVTAAKNLRAWALANPDGGTLRNQDGSERFIDRAEVHHWIASTDALLTDHAPSRREYLKERATILPAAKQLYPELFQSGSPAQKEMVQVLKLVPGLKKLPGYEVVIGDALAGMAMRLQQAEKSASGKPVVTKPALPTKPVKSAIAPAIPGSNGTGKPPSTNGKAKEEARQKVLKAGDLESLTNYFNAA